MTYEFEAKTGDLVCMDNVQPDLDLLKSAIEEGKKTVIKGKTGYTNVKTDI